jgi:AcrR family transcriptional regulator
MARKQAPDYEERRDAIVEQAAELFATRGFLGASVADLAQACGASKSLIYHYYPSKEDILFEVMDSHLVQLAEASTEVAGSGLAPAAALKELARRFMRLYVGAAARHKVLLNELDNLPAERRAAIVARQRTLIAELEQLLAKARPDLETAGRLTPAAMLFFGMINWTHTWFDPKGPVTAEAVADMASGLMLGQ